MKKIISALLAVLMLAGALSVAAGAQTFVNDETYVVGNVCLLYTSIFPTVPISLSFPK